jgi:hypothetical protein
MGYMTPFGGRGKGEMAHVRRERDQFRRVFTKTIRVVQTKAEVEAQIVAGGPAVFNFVVGCLQIWSQGRHS